MKKIFFVLVTVLFAVSMSAQKLCIWRDGQKLYTLDIQENDSITFILPDKPDTSVVAPTFDYDTWSEQTTINIFSHNLGHWQTVNLPWAETAVTTMPRNYRFPGHEMNNDSTCRWELAFNLCQDSTLDGVHMFGLWDSKAQIMRIYVYVEDLASSSAKYCFYRVESSHAAFIERDAMTWMPSEAVLHAGNWNTDSLSNPDARPSVYDSQLMPIAGTLDGQINRGWLCFDLNFSAGHFTIPRNGTITFSMYAVENIDLSGTAMFNLVLNGQNGKITIPGSKNKKAAGYLNAFGSFSSGIAGTIAQIVSAGENIGAGVAEGIAGLVGSGLSLAGNLMNAEEEGEDKNYNLALDFKGTADGEFKGSLSTTIGTTVSPVTMSYNTFFGEIIKHREAQQATDSFSIGAWNLKKQPVLYVCSDAYFFNYTSDYLLSSFLDPSSIELIINREAQLFNGNEISKVTVVGYDFAFVDSNYNFTAQRYYNFYRIPQDTIPRFKNYEPRNISVMNLNAFLLDKGAAYTINGRNNYNYVGVKPDSLKEKGLRAYDMIYSPAICPDVPYFNGKPQKLSDISVAVIAEIEFTNGDKRLFAERYLPQIKTYTVAQAAALKEQFKSYTPQTIEGIELDFPLFDQQIQKAVRLLNAQIYPMISTSDEEFVGFRVRPYQNDDNPGIVINTSFDDTGCRYSCQTLDNVFSIISASGDWETFDDRLDALEKPKLSNMSFVTTDPNTDYVVGAGCRQGTVGEFIAIYHEDANGHLTLQR